MFYTIFERILDVLSFDITIIDLHKILQIQNMQLTLYLLYEIL